MKTYFQMMKKIAAFFLLGFVFLTPTVAFAANGCNTLEQSIVVAAGGNAGLVDSVINIFPKFCEAQDLIQAILNIMFSLAGAITVMFIIIGGYWYMTSAGNAETADKGKKTVTYAVIGLIVVVLSSVILTVVLNLINGNTGAGDSNGGSNTTNNTGGTGGSGGNNGAGGGTTGGGSGAGGFNNSATTQAASRISTVTSLVRKNAQPAYRGLNVTVTASDSDLTILCGDFPKNASTYINNLPGGTRPFSLNSNTGKIEAKVTADVSNYLNSDIVVKTKVCGYDVGSAETITIK